MNPRDEKQLTAGSLFLIESKITDMISQHLVLCHQSQVTAVEELKHEGHQELGEKLGHHFLVRTNRQQRAQGLGCLKEGKRAQEWSILPLNPASLDEGKGRNHNPFCNPLEGSLKCACVFIHSVTATKTIFNQEVCPVFYGNELPRHYQ